MFEMFYNPPSHHVATIVGLLVLALYLIAGAAVLVSEWSQKREDVNLRQRYVSACVMGPLVLLPTYLGGIPFAVLTAALSVVCVREFLKLVQAERPCAYIRIAEISAGGFVGAALLESCPSLAELPMLKESWLYAPPLSATPISHNLHPFYILPVMVIMLILLVPLVLQRYRGMSIRESLTIFGILYFGWFPAHAVLLRNCAEGFGLLMFLSLAVVCNDVSAYATGRLIGKTKVAPIISPKKTEEGAFGGLIASIVVAYALRHLIPGLTAVTACVAGAAIGVAAPAGDLIVSVVKRDVGVKDSSALIPGHGGILDRLGSFIFATPIFYYGMRLAGLIS